MDVAFQSNLFLDDRTSRTLIAQSGSEDTLRPSLLLLQEKQKEQSPSLSEACLLLAPLLEVVIWNAPCAITPVRLWNSITSGFFTGRCWI